MSGYKMKVIAAAFIIIFVTGASLPAYSQKNDGAYTTGAYSELNTERTYLERVSDWFATVGKSNEEKALIMSRRRAGRKIADAQKAIARKKKEIEKTKQK